MDLSRLTAAVLAGGQGLRLRSVVSDRPKVLAPVNGRPFLSYHLDQLVRLGLRRVVLCTGDRSAQIEAELGTSYGPLTLMYSRETMPLGTAGALRNAFHLLRSDPVLVMNGDSHCPIDLPLFLSWHRARRSQATLWLTRVVDTGRYGRVQVSSKGEVLRFEEKAGGQSSAATSVSNSTDVSGWINAGVYLLSRRFIASIPSGVPASIERDTFPARVGKGLHGFQGGGAFLDIGTPESYSQAEGFFGALAQRAPPRPDPSAAARSARAASRRFVLLDRDGVLNVERHYLSDPNDVVLLPGAADGLKRLRDLGLGLVIITNQSGIGRGYFNLAQLEAVHARLNELLSDGGVSLDGIYFCPHRPDDGCSCRKPRPGLAHQAAIELDFDPKRAFVIGDKACDIALGERLGATTILATTGYGALTLADVDVRPDFIADDLRGAARLIRGLLSQSGHSSQRSLACQT